MNIINRHTSRYDVGDYSIIVLSADHSDNIGCDICKKEKITKSRIYKSFSSKGGKWGTILCKVCSKKYGLCDGDDIDMKKGLSVMRIRKLI